MGQPVLYLLFCFSLPALSIAGNVNNTQSTNKSCVTQEKVINSARVVDTCFKDLVQTQIQNNTIARTCTNLNDLMRKLDIFYNTSLTTCYAKGSQEKYFRAKPMLLDMVRLIFKDDKLAATDKFSCLKNKEARKKLTACIDFTYLRSNDTSNSYLWHRRTALNFGNMACNVRAGRMKNCTKTALAAAQCKKPIIELTSSMFDIVISNCNLILNAQNNTTKSASTHTTAFSCITLFFIGLISNNYLLL